MPIVHAIDHIVLNVRDVDASAAWYARVLGMTRRDTPSPAGDTRTSMHFGHHKINLRPHDQAQAVWFTGRTPATGSADLCFLTSMAPDEVARHVRACGVEVELGPVERSGAMGPIRSVYVRDPDGSLIEVASYPEGG